MMSAPPPPPPRPPPPPPSLPTLYKTISIGALPPYLPQDNTCQLEEQRAVLRCQVKALQALLKTKFPMFTSHVVYNPQLSTFLDGYLNYCSRPVEIVAGRLLARGKVVEPLPGTETLRSRLHQLVFLVYLRLFTSEDEQESSQQAMFPSSSSSPSSFAKLIQEQAVLDFPRVLDLCALYGFTEPALLARLLEAAFDLLQAQLIALLSDATTSILEVLVELYRNLVLDTAEGEEEDALQYLGDLAGGLSRLVQAVPLTGLTLAASPGLFKLLRKIYGLLLVKEEEENDIGGSGGGGVNVHASREWKRFYCRFIRRCVQVLTNGVVDGLIAHAHVEEGVIEQVFTLVGLLMEEKEDGDDDGGGDDEEVSTAAAAKNIDRTRLLQDCIEQRNGLLVHLKKLVSSEEGRKDGLDVSGIAYLVQLLEASSSSAAANKPKRRIAATTTNTHTAAASWPSTGGGGGGGAEDGMNRGKGPRDVKAMIEEVKQVCPDLGDGFVHACLAVMGYNTNMVVNALLEGNPLPYPLDTLDRTLPSPMGTSKQRRARGQADIDEAKQEERDEEFIALQKAYVQQMERQQEEDAYLLAQEYDDDYDDQYEEQGVSLSRDTAREDFESIKRYNTLVKQFEEEDKFWEDMRISQPGVPKPAFAEEEEEEEGGEGGEGGGGGGEGANRMGGRGQGQGQGQGRGGRGRGDRGGGGGGGGGGRGGGGRGRGGGRGGGGRGGGGGDGAGSGGGRGGGGGGESGKPMSALQKRRKEQQKDSRANHNRKSRALRKTGPVGGF